MAEVPGPGGRRVRGRGSSGVAGRGRGGRARGTGAAARGRHEQRGEPQGQRLMDVAGPSAGRAPEDAGAAVAGGYIRAVLAGAEALAAHLPGPGDGRARVAHPAVVVGRARDRIDPDVVAAARLVAVAAAAGPRPARRPHVGIVAWRAGAGCDVHDAGRRRRAGCLDGDRRAPGIRSVRALAIEAHTGPLRRDALVAPRRRRGGGRRDAALRQARVVPRTVAVLRARSGDGCALARRCRRRRARLRGRARAEVRARGRAARCRRGLSGRRGGRGRGRGRVAARDDGQARDGRQAHHERGLAHRRGAPPVAAKERGESSALPTSPSSLRPR
jgi:hypothetical protein